MNSWINYIKRAFRRLTPADCVTRSPGLYISLHVDDAERTRHQLVVFPIDQLDELEAAIKALRAVQ